MKSCCHIALLLVVACLFSCGNDDNVYPSVKLEFADIFFGADGYAERFTTDQGVEYPLATRLHGDDYEPNTVYRVLCHYLLNERQEVELHSCVKALTPTPKVLQGECKVDPVTLQSIWMGNGYVNMVLRIMAHEETHKIGVAIQPIVIDNFGHALLPLLFLHDRGDDIEGAYRNAYVSIPIRQLREQYPGIETISVSVNTYEKGMFVQTFPL